MSDTLSHLGMQTHMHDALSLYASPGMSAYITCTHGRLHCACWCVFVSRSATPPHRMQCLKAQPDICQHCNADEATDYSRNGASILATALVLHGHKESNVRSTCLYFSLVLHMPRAVRNLAAEKLAQSR